MPALERLHPQHILPGHGPLAYAHDLALFKRLQRYFLEEVAARVARQMPLADLLADLESQLPEWITALPVTWGTPRYAILRVYRGLVADATGEPGWQHYKPSAIPAGDATKVHEACAALTEVRAFQRLAEEFAEGGDVGSAIAVARQATTRCPHSTGGLGIAGGPAHTRRAPGAECAGERGFLPGGSDTPCSTPWHSMPQHPQARLALGRFLVMRAYRNGDDPTPGMAHCRASLTVLPYQRRDTISRCWPRRIFFWGWGIGHRVTSRLRWRVSRRLDPSAAL